MEVGTTLGVGGGGGRLGEKHDNRVQNQTRNIHKDGGTRGERICI